MKKLVLIQIFTLFIALLSGIGCVILGCEKSIGGFEDYYVDHTRIPVAGYIDGGYDGGALGLGIISALCFIGIVWIEITKFNANK